MALGVELDKNFAKVQCQIMISVGDAVLKFLSSYFFCRIEALFHATNRSEHPKKKESTLARRNFIKIMIDNKSFRF